MMLLLRISTVKANLERPGHGRAKADHMIGAIEDDTTHDLRRRSIDGSATQYWFTARPR
jgi:hypothetical protein